jgi:hypothetical protein
MVFRRIEYWIEGDRCACPNSFGKKEWNGKKKRESLQMDNFLNHFFCTHNVFLAYLISSDKLLLMIEEGRNHVSTLISLLILQEFSILFLHGFKNSFIIACPYGRLQGF